MFSETQGRYIVVAKEGETIDIDGAIEIGKLTDDTQFKLSNQTTQLTVDVKNIREQLKGAIGQCMKSKV